MMRSEGGLRDGRCSNAKSAAVKRIPGKFMSFPSLSQAVRAAYRRGEEDERLEPIVVVGENGNPLGRLRDDDCVIFYDIRGEREVELTRAFVDSTFDEFDIEPDLHLDFTTMIEYKKGLDVSVAFPPVESISGTLCHVLSENGKRFVKVAESEKSVHVQYFFNGKSDALLPGEEKRIIPSLRSLPEEAPEMRAAKVAETVISEIGEGSAHVIIANLANVDVVGHTEDEGAILRAIGSVDKALGKIVDAASKKGVTVALTADHGTVERWLYPDGTIDTGHTSSPVPFIIFEPQGDLAKGIKLRRLGELSDVAPTILNILGLEKPALMTGRTLIGKNPYIKNPRNRIALIILDGWGIGGRGKGNLMLRARTPAMDSLQRRCPFIRLRASGEAVGMPEGTVGNSEVGHLHLGSGRRIPSDRLRIDDAIKDGSFFINPALLKAMKGASSGQCALHLLGIVSFYSSHGSLEHLKALLRMARDLNVKDIYIHSILGRRGEKRESGWRYIDEMERFTRKLSMGKVVTVIGRHWVLDREENWDRVEKAYKTLVYGEGSHVATG